MHGWTQDRLFSRLCCIQGLKFPSMLTTFSVNFIIGEKLFLEVQFCRSHDGCPEWLTNTIALYRYIYLFSLLTVWFKVLPQWKLLTMLDAVLCQMSHLNMYIVLAFLERVIEMLLVQLFCFPTVNISDATILIIAKFSGCALCGQFNLVSGFNIITNSRYPM